MLVFSNRLPKNKAKSYFCPFEAIFAKEIQNFEPNLFEYARKWFFPHLPGWWTAIFTHFFHPFKHLLLHNPSIKLIMHYRPLSSITSHISLPRLGFRRIRSESLLIVCSAEHWDCVKLHRKRRRKKKKSNGKWISRLQPVHTVISSRLPFRGMSVACLFFG